MYVIKGLDFKTWQVWIYKKFDHRLDALSELSKLRKKRKHWKLDTIVFGLVEV